MAIYQILVKHIDGHTQCLQFPTPSLEIQTLIKSLALPYPLRLITGTQTLTSISTLSAAAGDLFPTVTVLPCLRGGKGGFGSLLRGAASKAGQKKTNNFDACRDMSGRRLRHVNAEKKLEEWKEEEEGRRLEKLGEEYLKKKAKEVRREKGKNGEVEKYMEKARIESEKCMEMVESSVRESFGLYREAKRKGIVGNASGAKSKKMKIWMGKNMVDDSDSDDEDEDGKGKSMVLNGENCNLLNNEEGTSKAGLVNTNSEEESSGKHSEQSNLEETIEASSEECSSGDASENCLVKANEKVQFGNVNGKNNSDSDVIVEAEIAKECAEPSLVSSVLVEVPNMVVAQTSVGSPVAPEVINKGAVLTSNVSEPSIASSVLEEVPNMEVVQNSVGSSVAPEIINNEAVQTANISKLDEPLDFEKYNSAKDLEVLGLERLKTELQSRGLKCGGTLPERAARLFLLKTTPFDKLPKKVLAAKK